MALFSLSDPVIVMLSNPEKLWGDVIYELEAAGETISTVTREMLTPPAPEPYYGEIIYTPEEEMLMDWEMPDISAIPALWRHFPVNVIPIESGAGVERFSIVWHRKHLTEWRNDRSANWDEYNDYQDWQEFRLKHSIMNHPDTYVLEEARNDEEICVIRMVRPSGFVVHAHAAPVVHAPKARPATLRALDVLRLAPVSWDRDGNKHYIKIHNKKIATMAADQRKNVTEVTKTATADLLAALKGCGDCAVTKASGYLCVVELL